MEVITKKIARLTLAAVTLATASMAGAAMADPDNPGDVVCTYDRKTGELIKCEIVKDAAEVN